MEQVETTSMLALRDRVNLGCLAAGRKIFRLAYSIVPLVMIAAGLALSACSASIVQAQDAAIALVARTLQNEALARKQPEHSSYLSRERSSRTGDRLWMEKVVQTENAEIHRLISIDGVPLTAEQAREEDVRITKLVAHLEATRKGEHQPSGGQGSGDEMIHSMTRAFVFTYDGQANGCTRLRYRPNPQFKPAGYRQRILHALEGTILVKEPEDRVCGLDGRISYPVEVGFGLMGKLEENGRIHIVRVQTPAGTWQVSVIGLHLVGRVLMLKDISQQLDEVRSDFHDLPPHLSVAQAAEIARQPAGY
jgi:hypothetical protein